MRGVVVTCFESDEERASFAYETLRERGYELLGLTSNFSHVKKAYRDNVIEGFEAIKTRSYKKNLSYDRIMSHIEFAKKAFKRIEEFDPDLIYCIAPANSLIRQAKIYKSKHPDVKIIVDIIDMWPESLPLSFLRNTPPAKIWRNIRGNNLDCADVLVSECSYYHQILSKEYQNDIKTLYWCKDSRPMFSDKVAGDKLKLCYLGSINNIIDTDLIKEVISNCRKDVELHIIGDGEKRELMINTLNEVCDVKYHGLIYDEDKKLEIMGKCHAGINIYKNGLYIGLTTKCIDYFQYGLPIINNIASDTWKFVEENGVGVNVKDNCFDEDKIIALRNDNKFIYDFYQNNFTKETFKDKLNAIIKEVEG